MMCGGNADCASDWCVDGVCAPKDCLVDDDCNSLDSDCTEGTCDQNSFACVATNTNEGGACVQGDLCIESTTCQAGECLGSAKDCSNLDDDCNLGVCDPNDGSCDAQPANEGQSCDDGDACTLAEVCQAGVCQDPDGQAIYFFEDFEDNSANWGLDDTWEIGATSVSPVGDVGGADPADDHTNTADNGVAGANIGGLVTGAQSWVYLDSPQVNTAAAAGDVQLRMWRWLNADDNGKNPSTVEVWDGGSWVTVWENGNSITADAAWTAMDFDVTAYKSATFRWRVGYRRTGSAGDASGWSVDDVTLAAPTCLP
jgi:hypothetical protein